MFSESRNLIYIDREGGKSEGVSRCQDQKRDDYFVRCLGAFKSPAGRPAYHLSKGLGSGHARVQDRLVAELCQHLCEYAYQMHLHLVLLLLAMVKTVRLSIS